MNTENNTEQTNKIKNFQRLMQEIALLRNQKDEKKENPQVLRFKEKKLIKRRNKNKMGKISRRKNRK